MAAVSTERKLKELRNENEHDRKTLAKVEPSSSLSQGALVLLRHHSQPTGAPKCQGMPWVIRLPRKQESHALRAQGSEVTCWFDSVSPAAEF